MIAGKVLAMIGLTSIIISFFLFCISLIIIIIVLKLLEILLNYVHVCLFLMQLRSWNLIENLWQKFYLKKSNKFTDNINSLKTYIQKHYKYHACWFKHPFYIKKKKTKIVKDIYIYIYIYIALYIHIIIDKHRNISINTVTLKYIS